MKVFLGLERRGGVAVDADEFSGDALSDLRLVERLLEDREAAVGVDVDKTWGDDVAGCVDNPGGFDMGNVSADDLYVFASDADAGVEAGASCSVDYLAVGYQQVKHFFVPSTLYPKVSYNTDYTVLAG